MGAESPTTERRGRRNRRDSPDHRSFLAEVATLYYVDKLNQEQIARQIGRSVAMVSRLLAEAHAAGIVEVRVNHPVPTDAALQSELVSRFGLRSARVMQTAGIPEGRRLGVLGELGAVYLKTILRDDAIISVGWGSTLYEVARALHPGGMRGIQVVQTMGSLGSQRPVFDNHLITRLFAERLDGTSHYLHAPMIVDTEAVRNILIQDAHLARSLALGRRADVILFGVGQLAPETYGLYQAGYIDQATLAAIRDSGAVGDICVSFFDLRGEMIDLPLSRRVIGLSLPEVTAIRTAIVVAGGPQKAPAILGAIRSGFVHVLVTDDEAARAVLALADQTADIPAPVHAGRRA